jgi:polyhydroxyalkanoate synthase
MISSTALTESPSSLDRMVQAWQARFTGGLSPAAPWLSYFDWLLHLSNSPGS